MENKNKRMKVTQWLNLAIQFAVIFSTFSCMAQETLLIAATKPNTVENAILNRTAPAGLKPNFNLSDCEQLNILTKRYSIKTNTDDDAQVVDKILSAENPDHGHRIFIFATEEVMWWVRDIGEISVQSLGVAVHESNHVANALLTKCNGGLATYFFDGYIIATEHKFGDTQQYSIATETIPLKLKDSHVGSRFSQYIEKNGTHTRSDFSALLDEFIAYTGGASLDISILRSKEYSWLVNREITGLDVNFGGMADFMIYSLSYLKALRTSYPEAYLRLRQQPKTLALLQMIWTTAEATLMSAYDLTQTANKDGILIVSRDAIAATYSNEFISELDILKITHAPVNSWNSSYLNSIN